MKIAFLADALDIQYAGIHYYTKNIIRSVSEQDSKNEYFVVRPNAKEDIPNVQELIVPIYPPAFLYQKARLFWQVPRLLQKHQIDIVMEPAHFGPFNLPKHIKRITFIHDLTPLKFPQFHPKASQVFHKLFLPSITRNADSLIVNSEHTKKDLLEYYPQSKGKITVIPLGKESIFKPQKEQDILKEYNLTQPYLLFVGTIEPRKNLGVLLDAYQKFCQKHNASIQLVLVGKKGWKNEAFFEKLAIHPNKEDILLTDYVKREHLPVLYSMAEAFVYPSLYEGFGLPVLEAMACGTPVITSNVSSLPEVGGDAVLYFHPNDAEALSQQIERIHLDKTLKDKLSETSLKQAKKFSWQRAGKETIDLFNKL